MWANRGTDSTTMDQRIRFGAFELDPTAGELHKSGVKVALSGQPLEVLAILTRRPGEVVTREELKEGLWPDETFVDFDNGLNSAVRRIRRALDDSPKSPRFLETLPKRGYRFIAEVDQLGLGEAAPHKAWEGDGARRGRWLWVLAGAFFAAVLAWWGGRQSVQPISSEFPSTQPIPITSLPGIEQHPTFSPDGSQVAFSWNGPDRGDFDIYVKSVSGAGLPHRLTDHPADDIMPAWSPDGQTIAFWRSNGNQSGIFLVSPLGGNERGVFDNRPPIRGNRYDSSQLSWSPDGTQLAYTDTRKVPFPIAIFSLTTGEEEVLTDPPAGGFDLFPAFSPDGRHVAWSRWAMGLGHPGVFTISLADRERERRSELAGRGIAWSGDSQSLITSQSSMFMRGPLRELNLADGTERPVPNTSLGIYPAAARTRGRFAYAMRLLNLDVLRVDLAPGPSELVSAREIFASTRLEMAPQISPDGSRIVLTSSRTGNRGNRLWVGGSNGSDFVDVASSAGIAARWSPDNGRIAFERRTPRGMQGIYVVDADGGGRPSASQIPRIPPPSPAGRRTVKHSTSTFFRTG